MTDKIIIAITGASGAIYGIRLLEELKKQNIETHLIISKTAQITIAEETSFSIKDIESMATHTHKPADLAACVASGSFRSNGMIIAPCSMKTLAEIATGITNSLISRAADVMLKDRRKLVLLTRETPLNLQHLRNMVAVTEMGGIIAPPVPAFYSRPKTLDDLVNHTIGRVLDLFDIDSGAFNRWKDQ